MEQKLIEEQLKNSPKRIKNVVLAAIIFGVLQSSHFVVLYFANSLSFAKAIGFALLVLFLFFSNGFSMFSKSKFAFFALILFSFLAILGIIGGSLHFLTMILLNQVTDKFLEFINSSIYLVQLFIMVWLYRNLFSAEVRNYIWHTTT